jgi:hypothetical protein
VLLLPLPVVGLERALHAWPPRNDRSAVQSRPEAGDRGWQAGALSLRAVRVGPQRADAPLVAGLRRC